MSAPDLPKENFPGGDVVPREGELRISIDKTAYAEILAHAKGEPDVEICGVLMGKLKQDKHGNWLHIQTTIRGEGAKQQGAQVTFTHEAWNFINKTWDRDYPQLSMIGWYHTHPGFDIFLSEMDKFIHKSHFDNPNQVAYVYDPHQGTEGFFRKEKDEIVLLDRFWHGGKPRKIIAPEQRVKATASAGVATGDASGSIAALTNRVTQLELEVRDGRGGGITSNLLLGVIILVAIMFVGWQMFRPRMTLPFVEDPRTGVKYSVEVFPEAPAQPPSDPKKPKEPPAPEKK